MRLTRFLIVGLVSLTCAAQAQSLLGTNRTFRALTLDECIREGLEHNLRIQISQYNPKLDRYRLLASYGIYDPALAAGYTRSYSSSEGRFNTGGLSSISSTSDSDAFSTEFVGVLPTGLRYNAGLDLAHLRGTGAGSGEFDNYTALADISLAQPLLKDFWIDAGRLNIQLSKRNVQISELQLEEQVRQIVRDVQLAYYELIFAQDDVKVQEKALELADTLAAQEKERVKVGTKAPLDERQAESAAATARAQLIQAQRRLLATENILKALITDRYSTWADTSIQPSEKLLAVPEPLNKMESWNSAYAKRADYRAILLDVEKQGFVVKYNKNQLYPDLSLVGGYGREGLDSLSPSYSPSLGGALGDIREGNNPRWTAGFTVRVPLGLRTERNRFHESELAKKQIELQVKQLEHTIQFEVDDAIIQAKGDYESVSATRQARIYAEEALAAEEIKLTNGKSTSFDVLGLQEKLTTARSAEIRALADYNKSMALLYFRDGTVLERARVTVRVK